MKHLFELYGIDLFSIRIYRFLILDADRDGSITPIDFEILADKLSTLVGQDDSKRRDEYSSARKILCEEIMRADANHDGKVTLGKLIFPEKKNKISGVFFSHGFLEEWLDYHTNLAAE